MLQTRVLSRANLRQAWRLEPQNTPFRLSRICPARPLHGGTSLKQRSEPSRRLLQLQSPSKTDSLENAKLEAVQKPADAKPAEPKTDLLLGEQTVSNKEQRRADWAIMKEMARYLWPKVASSPIWSLSFAGVNNYFGRGSWAPKSELRLLWLCWLARR